mgnify:CR=1 FL=1
MISRADAARIAKGLDQIKVEIERGKTLIIRYLTKSDVHEDGTRTVFHNEGGTKNRPKVYKMQLRPDPLANWRQAADQLRQAFKQ